MTTIQSENSGASQQFDSKKVGGATVAAAGVGCTVYGVCRVLTPSQEHLCKGVGVAAGALAEAIGLYFSYSSQEMPLQEQLKEKKIEVHTPSSSAPSAPPVPVKPPQPAAVKPAGSLMDDVKAAQGQPAVTRGTPSPRVAQVTPSGEKPLLQKTLDMVGPEVRKVLAESGKFASRQAHEAEDDWS